MDAGRKAASISRYVPRRAAHPQPWNNASRLKAEQLSHNAKRQSQVIRLWNRCLSDGSPPLEQIYSIPPGDLRYTAPELIASLHDVSPTHGFHADLYSLGAILFEMFSGSPLNLHLFDESTVAMLNQTMNAVHRENRKRIYDQIIAGIAEAHPLPSLSVLGTDAPNSIITLLDRLYMSLSAIDYRIRLVDFREIFLQINRCFLILHHEVAYQEWRRQREIIREAGAQKKAKTKAAIIPKDRSFPC